MSEISYDELSGDLGSFVIIDVRNRGEVEKLGQIPGSHCIPMSELDEAFNLDDHDFEAKYGFPKPAKDSVLVTYCMIGGRAKKAGTLLAEKGYPQARYYMGSFTDWTAKGGEVEPGKPFEPDS